ncbi:uncharacterized protein LOC123561084 [Mercenaria mercenaria]|uniref:uncharacterized protein LOC123561084 n=1 Tax=Mercenaria mercenaria TaxID=6596 RepID=UPI001E1DED04|nr:uncharacterized protein LOC123561084 [Mercenaria mercenaria]
MKNMIFVIAAILCIVKISVADDNSYRDVLENLEDRLISRLQETEVGSLRAQMDTHTETERDENFLNEGQKSDEFKAKKRRPPFAIDRVKPLPVCRPYVPFLPTSTCCERGFAYVDLTKNSPCNAIDTATGIEFLQEPTSQSGVTEDCSKTALLKVNFEKFTKVPCDYCLRKPLCGRRMLRIDLKLSSGTRSNWGFNIGDSRTNDGWKGDSNTQINDAETDGRFPAVRVYQSDKCPTRFPLKTFPNAIGPDVQEVTIYVSNQHIRIVNDQGLDEYVCDNCLYALNGQADSQGVNEDIYIGLNRVVSGRIDRNGVGVCSATLTWACPRW